MGPQVAPPAALPGKPAARPAAAGPVPAKELFGRVQDPAPLAALARKKPGDPARAERWELYLGGVEIANAYSELTDPAEQRARFEEANVLRQQRGAAPYPLDDAFLSALPRMPPSGGIALGVDRLLMILADADSLDGVLPFRHG
ncbi:MAG TPA: hypothetical protein PLK81_08395 [Kiritimatiellia bacterium]|nr:hypothetical protein [Kiritimatiellia bacterium]